MRSKILKAIFGKDDKKHIITQILLSIYVFIAIYLVGLFAT